jgi:uncharacterized protein YhdP
LGLTQGPSSDTPINWTITSENTWYQNKSWGQLYFEGLRLRKKTYEIKSLKLTHPFYALSLTKQSSKTGLNPYYLNFEVQDVKKTHPLFPLFEGIEVQKGYLQGEFNLAKRTINSLDSIPEIEGHFAYHFENGRIMDRKKQIMQWHLSRLFNLLNLKKLPQRLFLDFSDVLEKGYPFTRWEGHLELQKGNLSTKDSEIDSSIFTALIDGALSFHSMDWNMSVSVAPNISDDYPQIEVYRFQDKGHIPYSNIDKPLSN